MGIIFFKMLIFRFLQSSPHAPMLGLWSWNL